MVLGRIGNMGLTVVRVEGLGRRCRWRRRDEPKPGHLAVAVGRTWSGGVMAAFAPIAVVGGPLRGPADAARNRSRIRIQHAPHGALNGGALIDASGRALGIITSMAIRGTTVVIPASLAWAAATKVATDGGTKQGFLGVSSMAGAASRTAARRTLAGFGLLISQVRRQQPRRQRRTAGRRRDRRLRRRQPIEDAEELVTRLRGNGSARRCRSR